MCVLVEQFWSNIEFIRCSFNIPGYADVHGHRLCACIVAATMLEVLAMFVHILVDGSC